MRRSTFRRPLPERKPVVYTPAERMGVYAKAGGGEAVPKVGAYRSEAWRRAVASLPCIYCGKENRTQAAHPNHIGKGALIKAPDCWCVPLCVEHHAEFDQGKRWTKAEKRELMDRWIVETIHLLAKQGLVVPK